MAVPSRPMLTSSFMCQRKPQADKYKDAADAAIEPFFEHAARAEPAREPGRRPSDEQVPNRPIEIEYRAEEQERQRFGSRIRCDELREKRQKKQSHLGVQDIGEKALQEYAPHRRPPAIGRAWC